MSVWFSTVKTELKKELRMTAYSLASSMRFPLSSLSGPIVAFVLSLDRAYA